MAVELKINLIQFKLYQTARKNLVLSLLKKYIVRHIFEKK